MNQTEAIKVSSVNSPVEYGPVVIIETTTTASKMFEPQQALDHAMEIIREVEKVTGRPVLLSYDGESISKLVLA